MTNVIEVSPLTKVYATGKASSPLRAVDNIDLAVFTLILFARAVRMMARRMD
jgi:hypothetical protein